MRGVLALAVPAIAACTAIAGIDGTYTLASSDAGARDGAAGSTGDGGASEASVTFPADAGAVTKVVAGRFHTCAFFHDTGIAKCWGRNADYGELGTGTGQDTAVPVYAMTPGLTDLFAGAHDTCGLLPGGAECAGKGGVGELGDDVVDADSPVPEMTSAFPSAPTQIASGETFTCAVVAGGDVWCVGDGPLGQLGNAKPRASAPRP